jgi:hypothetical protein
VAETRIEILTRAPTEFFHCSHCEVAFHHLGLGQAFRAEQRAAALPADVRAEYARVSDWIGELSRQYGERLRIELIDVASLRGFFTALRYRAWRYPAIILDGKVIAVADGPDQEAAGKGGEAGFEAAARQIAERLEARG